MDIILNIFYFFNVVFSPLGILIITSFISNKNRRYNFKETYILTFVKLFKFTLGCLVINIILAFFMSAPDMIATNVISQIVLTAIIVFLYLKFKKHIETHKLIPQKKKK